MHDEFCNKKAFTFIHFHCTNSFSNLLGVDITTLIYVGQNTFSESFPKLWEMLWPPKCRPYYCVVEDENRFLPMICAAVDYSAREPLVLH